MQNTNMDLIHAWLDNLSNIKYAKRAIADLKRELLKRGFTKEEIKTIQKEIQKRNIKPFFEIEFNLLQRQRKK